MTGEPDAFPDEFWWGTGNSSNQCEGAAPAGTWWNWERTGHAPLSGAGNDFARRHTEDFSLLAGIGLEHFRLSLEWARLEPLEGRHDQAEIERYRALLQAARNAGLKVWVTAHHFTLPRWFADKGGFADDHARTYHWRRHVEFLAETFGDLVFGWKPINEPHAYAMCGWLLGVHPPGRTDLGEAVHQLVAAHLANHEAWLALRGGTQPVATIHDLSPSMPVDANDEGAQRAAATVDALGFDIWIDMIRDGVLRVPRGPGLPEVEPIENPGFVDAFDVVGFSYYSTTGVQLTRDERGHRFMDLVPYPADAEVGPLGYVPWSDGLRIVLDRLAGALGDKPLLIAEYGIGTADDAERCRYLDQGVAIAADALARGIDLKGFFHWTGIDNYEWEHGFDVAFGLFDVDRNPRPSAEALATRIGRATVRRMGR